jgi:SH3-like domain-containing protein
MITAISARILVLVLALAAPAFWAADASAEDGENSWEGTVRAKILNVRAGPSTVKPIVAKLKRGDIVKAFDEQGRWVHIRGFDSAGTNGWVSRAFLQLPEEFMAPAFGDIENAFLEWVSDRGDLAEISVEDSDSLSMVMAADVSEARAPTVAREIACAYRTRLSLSEPVVATVWPPAGLEHGWIVQVSCP